MIKLDARNLSCPEPLLMLKNAIKKINKAKISAFCSAVKTPWKTANVLQKKLVIQFLLQKLNMDISLL